MYNPSQPAFTDTLFPKTQPTGLNNNPYLHVPQPPGTDLYSNFGSHPLNQFSFQPQTSFFVQDRTAVSHNWVINEAAPIRYDAVKQPINETSMLPTKSYSLWTHQPLISDATSVPQQANFAQTVRCDVCNVDCLSKDVFEKHLQDNQHIQNLQVRNYFESAMLATSNALNLMSLQNQTGTMDGHLGFGTSTVTASPQLEMKKIKVMNSGTMVDSVRVCAICNVVCNSQDVFNKHMSGRKHAVQADLAALREAGPYFAAVRAQFEGTFKKPPKKIKFVQPAWCEVCEINLNSNDVYLTHLSGKKHQKNLELRKLSSDPNASTYPIIGPEENPEPNKGKTVIDTTKAPKKSTIEDMQAKRHKIVKAGAAMAAIRTCTICNVVCNSLTVFNFHLGGQKHKDMVKSLQESGVASSHF